MNISIIGSGNVATILARLLKQNDFSIEEIVSRNKAHALQLATELNAVAVDNITALLKNSDVYIIAVNDDAIEKVADELKVNEKIVVHTCGSASINVLKNTSVNYGVFYPLQSLRKEINYKADIPFLIDANNDYTKNFIRHIAATISNNVTEANDEQRLRYHVSAIIVSNFTNHLFALAKKYCEANHLNFSLLLPLIEETVKRLNYSNPAEMQTGPAIREDVSTIQKHISLLKNYPQLQHLYKLMSNSIIHLNKK